MWPFKPSTEHRLPTLNADLGESWYETSVGNDAALMPFLDTCNIACGFHAGDTLTMQRTIDLALENGVAIGAHPSFADRKNFGRHLPEIDAERLISQLAYQISALKGMVERAGGKLHHVKPHGALYHYLAEPGNEKLLSSFAKLLLDLDIHVAYGPPRDHLALGYHKYDVEPHREGFADRRYELTNGHLSLRSRAKPNATIADPEESVSQVQAMLSGQVPLADGTSTPAEFETVCLHGDHPGAAEKARLIRQLLDEHRAA